MLGGTERQYVVSESSVAAVDRGFQTEPMLFIVVNANEYGLQSDKNF